MLILILFLAVLVGMSLGLIGGGGSILTVPIMTYVKGINPVLATSYSLFVVGVSSFLASFLTHKNDNVHFKTVLIFGLPSIISVYLTRLLIMPAIPDVIFNYNGFEFNKQVAIMILFAFVMFLSAISMIKSKSDYENKSHDEVHYNYFLIALEGAIVGLITGIVGSGGGFMMIPILALVVKLPMKTAIGTALMIAAIKSLLGFVGDIQTGMEIDWSFLLLFTSFAVVGIFFGVYLSKFISGKLLKKSFGYFVLSMSFYIIIKESLQIL